MNVTWITLLTFTGILFGSLVSIHFLTVRRPGIAIKSLGMYTLALTAGLSEYIFQDNPTILKWTGAASLLYGPFLYLYVKFRLLPPQRLTFAVIKHFIFFILYCVLLLISTTSSPPVKGDESEVIVEVVLYEMLFIQIFSYCIYALVFVARNKNKLIVEDVEIGKMQIAFMRVLVGVSITLFFGSFAATHVFLLIGIRPSLEFQYSVQISLCAVIFLIALLNTETMYARKLVKVY